MFCAEAVIGYFDVLSYLETRRLRAEGSILMTLEGEAEKRGRERTSGIDMKGCTRFELYGHVYRRICEQGSVISCECKC